MLKICPLIKKVLRNSFFDEFEDPHKDFEIDVNRLWIKEEEFEKLKQTFQYFSEEMLIEGLLFKKSVKTEWFRNRYFVLFADRLICYKDVEKKKMKGIMMLRGVKLEIFDNLLELLNLPPKEDYESFEKKMFCFSRNQKYYTIFAGNHEIYLNWLQELKKCCIITNFNKYYKNVKIIGKGTFAKVMHSIRETDNMDFAIKTFEKQGMLNSQTSNRSRLSLLNEINIMRRLDHNNIIKMYEVYEGEYHIYIVLELLKGGELFDRIVKKGNYSERDAIILITRLLKALEYIHSKGIMHRDIKPENLILKDENSFDLKLADFGLSEFQNKKENLFTRCGTPGYVAPEVLEDKKYDTKCDIFSAGVILYILLTGCSPFYGKNYNEILSKNRKCEINYNFQEKMKLKISEGAINLMQWMLTVDHTKRPSAQECLSHYWILDRFVDLKADNLLLEPQAEEQEMSGFAHLGEARKNLENLKMNLTINVKDLQKDNDLTLVVNSPLITGKMSFVGGSDSPLNRSAMFRKSIKKNDISFQEKSALLGKIGFLKPIHIAELNSSLNSSLLHSQSFQTESAPNSSCSKDFYLNDQQSKSPSKFSISRKNNQVIQLNFATVELPSCKTREDEDNITEEEKKDEDLKHRRNHSVAGASSFKKFEELKRDESHKVSSFKKLEEKNREDHDNKANSLIKLDQEQENAEKAFYKSSLKKFDEKMKEGQREHEKEEAVQNVVSSLLKLEENERENGFNVETKLSSEMIAADKNQA